MTCVVGVTQNGRICFGADSASANGWFNFQLRKDPKIFRVADMLIGFTSSWRMGQILRYKLKLPEHRDSVDVYDYLVADFIEAVRDCLKKGGYAKIEDNVERGGYFLVGYRGRLFTVEPDFQIGESLENYVAIGCGEDLALGSLYATIKMKSVRRRVLLALEAAEKFSAGVAGPFNILDMPTPREHFQKSA